MSDILFLYSLQNNIQRNLLTLWHWSAMQATTPTTSLCQIWCKWDQAYGGGFCANGWNFIYLFIYIYNNNNVNTIYIICTWYVTILYCSAHQVHQTLHARIHRVKWRHNNLWSRYDLHVVGRMMSSFARLTGKDMSRYLNKIESVGLRKAYIASARSAIWL